MRTFSLLLAFVLIGVCLGAEQEPAKTPPTMETTGPAHAGTCVAVLCSQAAGVEKLVPLVELRLGQNKDITLLEREKIQEIFREQELQILTSAEGTAKRIALGKLLKADMLVLLCEVQKPQRHAQLIVCETKQGLRLCNQLVELSKNVESDAVVVVRAIDAALQRQRTPLKDIVAVPPFVNNTLVFEGDYLKASCAELIEELLADQPGVRVVELAEAQAIAKELSLLGDSNVQRRLPLYLMGEYRLENSGGKKDVSFKLTLLRGTSQIDQQREDAVSLDVFPGRIRDAASAMFFKALGQAVKPPDPVTEAKQLADRAQLSARLGLWEEAMPLAEASLMVKPDQWDLHREAAFYMDQLIEARRSKTGYYGNGPMNCNGPTKDLALSFLPTYLMHVETYLIKAHPGSREVRLSHLRNGLCELLMGRVRNARSEEEFEKAKAAFEPVMAMTRRVIEAEAASNDQDPLLVNLFRYMHLPAVAPTDDRQGWLDRNKQRLMEVRADGLRLLQQFAYLKKPMYIRDLLCEMSLDTMSEANEIAYYRKLAELPFAHGEAQGWLEMHYASPAYQFIHAQGDEPGRRHLYTPWNGTYFPPRPKETVEDVSFHPLPFSESVCNCLPLAAGTDLVVAGEGFFLMKEKGRLRRLPLPERALPQGGSAPFDSFGEPRTLANVCFDGRYLWVAVPDPDGFLAVIDPQTERIEKITAEVHLPPMTRGSVAPLAPGKICAAGSFGRTWCAIATFDPEKGKSLKVFFEAREVRDARRYDDANTHIAFDVGPMRTLTAPEGTAKAGQQRVFLTGTGRGLLIDPQKSAVEKAGPWTDARSLFCVHEGALYWRQAGGADPVWRFGFPDFQQQTVHDHVLFGPAVVYQGRIWMFVQSLSYARSFKDRFTPLRHNLPANGFCWDFYPAVSNHYGLLVLGSGRAYQVELHKPMAAADAAADATHPTEPLPDAAAIAAELARTGSCVTYDQDALGRPVIAIDLYDKVDAAIIAKLKAFPELQALGVRIGTYNGSGLAQLKGLARLHSLCLDLRAINEASMNELVALKQLRSLELGCGGRVSASALAKLKELPNLRSLVLELPRYREPGASYLAGLADLETLKLWLTPIGRPGLARLKELPKLRRLDMVHNSIQDGDLAGLKDAASLETLNLFSVDIGDAGLASLRGLNRLQTLGLLWMNITDAGLAHIEGLESLQAIDLTATAVGDRGLEHLAPLARLRSLNLHGTKITDTGLGRLARFPRLQDLTIGKTEISDAGLVKLRALSHLRSLNLDDTAIGGAALQGLSDLPELESLSLRGTPITDRDTAILITFANLRTLYLGRCGLNGASIPSITRIPKLEALEIDQSGSLQHEWSSIKQLRPEIDELHYWWGNLRRVKGQR